MFHPFAGGNTGTTSVRENRSRRERRRHLCVDVTHQEDTAAMMVTLSRLYTDGTHARRVVEELKASGLPEDDIGIIAPSRDKSLVMANADMENSGDVIDRDCNGRDDRNETVGKAAGIGAALGGAAGLLAGLGAFVLPGVGAVVAAGWVAGALGGVVAGGAVGGIIGALIESGVSENDAAQFADGVKRGGSLVTIRVMEQDRDFFNGILDARNIGAIRGGYEPAGMPVQLRDPGQHVKRT
jgi:hypothetical protein